MAALAPGSKIVTALASRHLTTLTLTVDYAGVIDTGTGTRARHGPADELFEIT